MNIDLGNIKVEENHESIERNCPETFSFQIKTEEYSNSYCTKELKTESNENELPKCDLNQAETYKIIRYGKQ